LNTNKYVFDYDTDPKEKKKPAQHTTWLQLENDIFEELDKENACTTVASLDAKFFKTLRLLLLSIENIRWQGR